MFIFTVIFITIFLIEVFYIKYASSKGIIDKPKHSSIQTIVTVRGGGIIFIPAIFFFILFFHEQIDTRIGYFILAILILAVISFIDDLKTLSPKTRLVFHFIATTIALLGSEFFNKFSLTTILITTGTYFLIIGYSNIYNFMDGINGMSFLNALCSYITFYLINTYLIQFTDSNLIVVFILATIVFGYFNFRKKPKCFLGDVGSVTIGFTIIFFTLQLYIATNNVLVFSILGIHSIDGGWTIIERLYRKENIFKPHLRHLYELFAYEFKKPHLIISIVYFIFQLVLNVLVYYSIRYNYKSAISFFVLLVILSLVYFILKKKVYKKIKQNNGSN